MKRKSLIWTIMQAGLLVAASSIAFSLDAQVWFTDETSIAVSPVVAVASPMLPISVPVPTWAVPYAVKMNYRTFLTRSEPAAAEVTCDEPISSNHWCNEASRGSSLELARVGKAGSQVCGEMLVDGVANQLCALDRCQAMCGRPPNSSAVDSGEEARREMAVEPRNVALHIVNDGERILLPMELG